MRTFLSISPVLAVVVVLLTKAACVSSVEAPSPAPVTPLHFHTRADAPQSCAWKCSPWTCTAAFNLETQLPDSCEQEEHSAYCLCEFTNKSK